jgi:hypothetical protein
MSSKPKTHDDPNIVISTYQSLEKYPKSFFQHFEIVCVDECLHPESLITMADGSKKQIQYINQGDLVMTINEKTKELDNKEVEYVYHNMSKGQQMYEIELENGQILKITGNHKVMTNNGWKRADKLTEYDDLLYID